MKQRYSLFHQFPYQVRCPPEGHPEPDEVAEAVASSVLSSSSATQSRTEGAHLGLALMAVVRGDAVVSGQRSDRLDQETVPEDDLSASRSRCPFDDWSNLRPAVIELAGDGGTPRVLEAEVGVG